MARAKTTEPPRLWARIVVGALLFAAVLGVLGAAGLGVHYFAWTQRPTMADGTVTIVIPRGTSWSGVVQILGEAGVVTRPRYFDFWGRRAGLPAKVKAGTYRLEGPLELRALAEKLGEGGAIAEITVTIPEGFNLWAIGARLEEQGLVDRRDFDQAARDPAALERAGLEAESFEGYLFPDTYRIATGSSAADIVAKMHARFVSVWGELGAVGEANGLSRHELVTLASIVEKETAAPAERTRIARVFYNRLAQGMRLQTDPTCVYSEERWAQTPTPRDCKDPLNRYSTYVVDGLPPGPIANPGRDALRAAIEPSAAPEDAELIYFVARGDGSGEHTFSKTLDEHNAAVRVLIERQRGAQ